MMVLFPETPEAVFTTEKPNTEFRKSLDELFRKFDPPMTINPPPPDTWRLITALALAVKDEPRRAFSSSGMSRTSPPATADEKANAVMPVKRLTVWPSDVSADCPVHAVLASMTRAGNVPDFRPSPPLTPDHHTA